MRRRLLQARKKMNHTQPSFISRFKLLLGGLTLMACTACSSLSPMQQTVAESWKKVLEIENGKIDTLIKEDRLEAYEDVELDGESEAYIEAFEAAMGVLSIEAAKNKDISKLLELCESGISLVCFELAPKRRYLEVSKPEDAWRTAPTEAILKGLTKSCRTGGVFACLGSAAQLQDDLFDEALGRAEALKLYQSLCEQEKVFCSLRANLILEMDDPVLTQEAASHFKEKCESNTGQDTSRKARDCISYARSLDKLDSTAHAAEIKALLTAHCDASSEEALCARERSTKPANGKTADPSTVPTKPSSPPATAKPAAAPEPEQPTAVSPAPARETPRDSCAQLSNGSAVRVSVPGYPQRFSAMVLSTHGGRASVRVMHPTAPKGVSGRSFTVPCQSLLRAQ